MSTMRAVAYIGDKLRRLRTERVLKQSELAESSGVGVATIVRIENNQVEPHVSTIRKLANALGVDASELVSK